MVAVQSFIYEEPRGGEGADDAKNQERVDRTIDDDPVMRAPVPPKAAALPFFGMAPG